MNVATDRRYHKAQINKNPNKRTLLLLLLLEELNERSVFKYFVIEFGQLLGVHGGDRALGRDQLGHYFQSGRVILLLLLLLLPLFDGDEIVDVVAVKGRLDAQRFAGPDERAGGQLELADADAAGGDGGRRRTGELARDEPVRNVAITAQIEVLDDHTLAVERALVELERVAAASSRLDQTRASATDTATVTNAVSAKLCRLVCRQTDRRRRRRGRGRRRWRWRHHL